MLDQPQTALVAIGTLFMTTTWITTISRIYVKAFMVKNFGTEDYLAVIALALFTASVGIALKGIMVSGGKHFTQLTLPAIKESMMWWWYLELFYTVTITCIRASVAIFILRIAVLRWQKVIIWTWLTIITLYNIFYFFFVIFQCSPPSIFWIEFGGNSEFCVPAHTFGEVTYVHSALGAATDWILAIIPIFIVAGLKMNRRTKISVSFVLGLGGIAAIAVIIRLPYVKTLVESKDFLYDCTNVVIWTSIEPGLGLTAASMATLRPLFQAFLNRSGVFGNARPQSPPNSYEKSKGTQSRTKARKGYPRSTSFGGDADSDTELAETFDFEVLSNKLGTVTTTVASPGLREVDYREFKRTHRNRSRSGSLSGLKKSAEWNRSGEDCTEEHDEVPALPVGEERPSYQIRKTVEIMTQSGRLMM